MILFWKLKFANLFRPRFHRVLVEGRSGVRREFIVREGSMLLDVLLARGVAYPHLCKLGDCGRCRSHLLSGSVIEARHTPGALSEKERALGCFFPCRATPTTDLEVRVLGPRAAVGDASAVGDESLR